MASPKRFSPPTVGGTSLLIIFAVLCLTIFALLAMSTVQADSRLSEVSANASAAYYTADLEAETIFAKLRSGTVPENVRIDGNTYSYTCHISENQDLMISVVKEEGGWKILR